jgi:hypothetical protein
MLTTIEKCLYSLTTSLINLKSIFFFSQTMCHVKPCASSPSGRLEKVGTLENLDRLSIMILA